MKARAIALLVLALAAGSALAQNKCVDGAGKVTYTSQPCDAIGMSLAGSVEQRINVAPAQKSASTRAKTAAAAPPAKKVAAAKTPERRCFQVRHVSGTSGIRCNDDPGAQDPVATDERTRGEVKAK